VVAAVAGLVSAFILPPCTTLQHGQKMMQAHQFASVKSEQFHVLKKTRLNASNESIPEFNDGANESSNNNDPLTNAKSTLDKFTSSSVYRTLLVSTPILLSSKIRSVVTPPILVGIVLIALVVYTYQDRFDNLADYSGPKRQAALRRLRQAKADQLSSKSTTEDIAKLAKEYEDALREELQVRVIIPGIWKIPLDPAADDWSTAPQFLGLEITENYELKRLDE
jgi:hypothetical protein